MTEGITNVWHDLVAQDPQDVCRRAAVSYDTTKGGYAIPTLGGAVQLFPKKQYFTAEGQFAKAILPRIQFHAQLAFPFYLVHAQDRALAGQFINPRALKGGDFFARGTHAPPLDKVAKKYGSDLESFIAQGIALGGQKKEFGDAAWQVYPVPRISVLIVLWREDEEFPPRAELLFDQIPTTYLPIDVLWSFAMMSINAIL